jgi:hypothetical protein
VNVRTSRALSLSMIRQCRKARSEGSSVFNEKLTENVSPGLEKVILPSALRPCVLARSRLWPHKQPANAIALLALPITHQSITCARGAFLLVVLIQRASNDTPTGLSIRSLAARLSDARGAVGGRSAFCTSAYWHHSPAHTLALSGPTFVLRA